MSATSRISIGEVTIDRIVEQESLPFFDFRAFFPSVTPELLAANRHWLEPRFLEPATGKVILTIQSYLIRTRHHTILVDSCVGNHKTRPTRPMWNLMTSDRYQQNLAAAGVGFEDIDFVMCTHLHGDHVGWNTRLDNGRWVPTFPNARYLFTARELEFWSQRSATDPASCPWIQDSVLPIVEAGRAEIVASDHRVDDHVALEPTPGHTIDHFAVAVGKSSGGALITGDMVHSPIQLRDPGIGMAFDYDTNLGSETRRRVLARCCDAGTLICTAHFPSPSAVRLTRLGDGYDFVEG